MRKKKGMLVVDKTAVIIIAVFTLILLLTGAYFYLWPKIQGWINAVPDYGEGHGEGDDEIIDGASILEKCSVDEYTCGVLEPECYCLNGNGGKEKCGVSKYCYAGSKGCDTFPTSNLASGFQHRDECKLTNENFVQAPLCDAPIIEFLSVKKEDVVKFRVVESCTCFDNYDSQRLKILEGFEEVNKDLLGFRDYKIIKDLLESYDFGNLEFGLSVCEEGEYCAFGEGGCVGEEFFEKFIEDEKTESKSLQLFFTKAIDDEILVKWVFGRGVYVFVKPNGDNNFKNWFGKEDADSLFSLDAITDDIYEEDIANIKSMLLSETPLELSENILEVLESGRARLYSTPLGGVDIGYINNKLYGGSSAPNADGTYE